MGYYHGTYGWCAYEQHVAGLAAAGIPYSEAQKDERYIRGPSSRCCCRCLDDALDSCHWCTRTCGCFQRLRAAAWTDPATQRRMVCEEFLAVNNRGSRGASMVTIVVYEDGHRPELRTVELDDERTMDDESQREEERYYTDRNTEVYQHEHFPWQFEEDE
ncbi:hypothetical protein HY635_03290 [Candidatus Uhrbacteria bacterium]|nr:hypothetical protein [Candidatus Uhrbacteria bacterium]